MAHLIIMRGLPASGKTTWAKQLMKFHPEYVYISKDELRQEMLQAHPENAGARDFEYRIHLLQQSMLLGYIKQNKTVVVDNTHMKERTLNNLVEFALQEGATYEVCDMAVDWLRCAERDINRRRSGERYVGQSVILQMAIKAPEGPNIFNGEKRDAFIFDCDGTLTLCDWRRHYLDETPPNWDAFNANMGLDPRHESVVQKWFELHKNYPDAWFLVTTGREERFRSVTEEWFEKNLTYCQPDLVLMRKSYSRTDDTVIKEQMLKDLILPNFNVIKVFDDRNKVVEMWRKNGLDVEQVAEGDF